MEKSINYFIYGLIIILIPLYLILPEPRKGVINPQTGLPKVVITYVGGGVGRDRELFAELEEKFEKKYPDVDLKFIRTTLPRKIDTMISGGVAPDIISVTADRVAYYFEVEALTDLTPFIDREKELKNDLETGGDFYNIMLEPFRSGDKIYMIPTWYVPFFIFYNKDLFDKYNVPYPDEDWSWEDFRERSIKLTHDTNGDGIADEFGLHFAQWQHGVEPFILQNGGRILSEDGKRVEIDNPKSLEALQFLYDLKFRDKVCPSKSMTPGVQTGIAFVQGRIAMYGPYGIFAMVPFREQITDFDWDVAVLPKGPDGIRAGIVMPTAFGVSSQSKHKQEAFNFVKFISSKEGMEIVAKWSLFVPSRKSVARSRAFLDPGKKPEHIELVLHDVENGYAHTAAYASSRYFEVYEVINEHIMSNMLDYNTETPAQTVKQITEQSNRILNQIQPASVESSKIAWPLIIPFLILLFVIIFFLFYLIKKYKHLGKLSAKEARWGYLLITPWIIGFLCLTAGPILFSIGLSFYRWQSLAAISSAKFVGLENFITAFSGEDTKYYKSLYATFKYAFLAVPSSVIVGLLLAVLMNAKLKGITIFRTLYFIPSVVPIVATSILWWYLFNPSHGWINYLLTQIGIDGPNWLGDGRYTIIVLVLMSLWGIGGSMIIYLAGLQAIPSQLYEAAETDGAGTIRQFWHITLPMISPILFFNLVMGLIGAFQVFTQAYVMFERGGGPNNSALFYVLHLYKEAIERYNLGYGSAMAWILFVIILFFTLLVFKSSPMWVYYEGERGE